MNLGVIFVSEMVGTAMLLLLGCGVVANVALAKTKGNGGGFLLVNFGWGLAVFAGVIVSVVSGAHINPAVTLGLATNILGKGGTEFVPGIPIDGASIATYIGAAPPWASVMAYRCRIASSGASLGMKPSSYRSPSE